MHRATSTRHLERALIQAAVAKTSAMTLQATEATVRVGLQHMLRMVMTEKKLPDALVNLFAQNMDGDAEAMQTTLNGALDQLAKGEISPELEKLLSESSETLAIPETVLRTWCLQLGQGQISDEMWNFLRQKVTGLQPFVTAMTQENAGQS